MPNIKLDITAENHAEGAIKGLISSIGLAQLATKALESVFQEVKKSINESVAATNEAQKVNNQMITVFGDQTSVLSGLANVMKEKYNRDDDLIKSGMLYANMIGVQTDKMKETTEEALGLSRAMGTDLNTAIKVIKLAQDGHVEVLGRLMPQLKGVKDQTEALSVINEKSALGLKLLEQETNSYEGLQTKVKLGYDDMLKSLGKYVQIAQTDYLKTQVDINKSIEDFLSNKQNLASFSAIFTTVGDVLKSFGTTIKNIGLKEFDKIKNSLKNLFDESKNGISIFDVLAAGVKGLSLAFSISAKFTSSVIQGLIDLGLIGINTGKVVGALYDVIFNKANPKTVLTAIDNVGNAIKNFTQHSIENTKDIIKTAIDGFKTFPEQTKSLAETMKKNSQDAYNAQLEINQKYQIAMGKQQEEFDSETEAERKKRLANEKKHLEDEAKAKEDARKKQYEEDKKGSIQTKELAGNSYSAIYNAFQAAAVNIANASKSLWADLKNGIQVSGKEIASFAGGIASGVLDMVGSIISSINSLRQSEYQAQEQALQEALDAQIASIQAYYAQQAEEMGIAEETETEKNNKSIADLQEQLENEKDIKKKAKLQEQIKELQDANARIALEEKMNADITAAKKKEAAEEKKLKKEAWDANRDSQVTGLWISALAGIATIWGTAMQLGPIAGPIMAGILTAAILATAGAETGIIYQQKNPYAEMGGVLSGTSTTGDKIPVMMNSKEVVYRDDTYQGTVQMFQDYKTGKFGGGITIQNLNLYVQSIPDRKELKMAIDDLMISEGVY